MDSLHQRLLSVYELLRKFGRVHTIRELATIIGKNENHVSAAIKGDPKRCTLGLMKAIAAAFPDVLNPDYLLTGEGYPEAPDPTMRPHYSALASAGFMAGLSEGETGTPWPRIPGIPDYDFTIEAYGDSMTPEIHSGDTLACRRATDAANPPLGRICVIDAADGAAVKVLARADADTLTLRSLNPEYKEYTLPNTDIHGIAEVVAVLRRYF